MSESKTPEGCVVLSCKDTVKYLKKTFPLAGEFGPNLLDHHGMMVLEFQEGRLMPGFLPQPFDQQQIEDLYIRSVMNHQELVCIHLLPEDLSNYNKGCTWEVVEVVKSP